VGVLLTQGFGSAKAFLTQRTGMAPGKASSVVSAARTQRSYAATRTAQVGDQFVLNGALTLENGAALKTLLDRMRDAKYREGSLTPDEQPTHDAVDERRRHAASAHQDALSLAQLVRLWLGNGMVGQSHGVKPHVNLITTVDDVTAGFPGELIVPGFANPVLVNGETVKRMLCDASVTELSSAGSVVDRHAHHHDGVPCHGPAHHGGIRRAHVQGVPGVRGLVNTCQPTAMRENTSSTNAA
jgi:hypothetical protein